MRSAEFPALGFPDSTPDIRGGVGADGMKALYDFVREGGTLITEGGTASLFPNLNLAPGVKVENPQGLFVRGSVMRGMITDKSSPLVYGYQFNEVPVYFNSSPVLNAGAPPVEAPPPVAAGGGRGGAAPGRQNTTPNAGAPIRLSPWDPAKSGTAYGMLPGDTITAGRGGRGAGGGGNGRGGAPAGATGTGVLVPGIVPDPNTSTRVVMQFPSKAEDMLLSGTIENGYLLANRAQLVDEKIGNGHVVMFAIRPYWRWETHGNYAMGFNAIMNWNDLDAGK
jgi:hypothetical protein